MTRSEKAFRDENTARPVKHVGVKQDADLWWRVTVNGRMTKSIYRTLSAAMTAARSTKAAR